MAQSKTTTKKHFRFKFKFKEFLREAWPMAQQGPPLAQVREKAPYKPFLAGSPSLGVSSFAFPRMSFQGSHPSFSNPTPLLSSLPWAPLYSLHASLKHHHWQGWATENNRWPHSLHILMPLSKLLVLLNNWKRRIIRSAIWEAGQAHRLSPGWCYTR